MTVSVIKLGPEWWAGIRYSTSSVEVPLESGRTVRVMVARDGDIDSINGPATDEEEAEILDYLEGLR